MVVAVKGSPKLLYHIIIRHSHIALQGYGDIMEICFTICPFRNTVESRHVRNINRRTDIEIRRIVQCSNVRSSDEIFIVKSASAWAAASDIAAAVACVFGAVVPFCGGNVLVGALYLSPLFLSSAVSDCKTACAAHKRAGSDSVQVVGDACAGDALRQCDAG